jgi:hypothetical protein
MIASLAQLVSAVRVSLDELVLPDLKPNSWTSGNVRSCLALLTYIEDALAEGQHALSASNDAMLNYIDSVIVETDSPIGAEMRNQVANAVAILERTGIDSIERLHDINAELKSLLSAIVAQSLENPDCGEEQKHALYACLRAIADQDLAIAKRASEMPPF